MYYVRLLKTDITSFHLANHGCAEWVHIPPFKYSREPYNEMIFKNGKMARVFYDLSSSFSETSSRDFRPYVENYALARQGVRMIIIGVKPHVNTQPVNSLLPI